MLYLLPVDGRCVFLGWTRLSDWLFHGKLEPQRLRVGTYIPSRYGTQIYRDERLHVAGCE